MDPPLRLVCGEHRDIEEEIANRILSDISEETSLTGSLLSIDELDVMNLNVKEDQPLQVETKERSPSLTANEASRGTTPIASPTLTIDSVDTLQPPLFPTDSQLATAADELQNSEAFQPQQDEQFEQRELVSDADKVSPKKDVALLQTVDLKLLNRPVEIFDPTKQSKHPMQLDPKIPVGAPLILEGLSKPHALEGVDVALHPPVSPRSPRSLPGTKSPVLLSPGREYAMEVVIATKQGVPEITKPMNETTKELKEEPKHKVMSSIHDDLEKYRPSNFYKEPVYEKPDIDDDYWDSNYQIGPETLLIATRGPEFNARLRDYRRTLWGDGAPLVTQGILGYRNQDITVRERRRYTDLLREEELGLNKAPVEHRVNDDIKQLQRGAVRRMQTDISKLTPVAKKQTGGPIFKRRLKDIPVTDDLKVAVLECEVMGKEKINVTWSHFEASISEDDKHKVYFDGVICRLTISDITYAELGDYSCAATNEYGADKTTARLISGDVPGRPGQPVVELASDTEAFLMWETPMNITSLEPFKYRLELRPAGENDHFSEWRLVDDDIEEDAAIVRFLTPLGIYQFRVTARNVYGYGIPSMPSRIIQTHPKNVPKLQIEQINRRVPLKIISKPPRHLFANQTLKGITEEEESEEGEGSAENASIIRRNLPLILNTSEDPSSRFRVGDEVLKGRFSSILYATDFRAEKDKDCIAKIIEHTSEAADPLHEFTALKECQHENVVHLIAAYQKDSCFYLFMERLYEDLFQRFIFYDYYNEEQIAHSIAQIVSAVHWFHYKGIAHLDIQPSNIMFTSRRSWHLKLVDFGNAQAAGFDAKYPVPPNVYWAAPEMHDTNQPVNVQSDVWGIGIITFCLLAGFHPFADDSDTEDEVKNSVLKTKCNPNLIFVQASQESLRFVTWAMKKNPARRMRTEEALQHRWLCNDKSLGRRRESIRYPSSRLRKTAIFTADYFKSTPKPETKPNFDVPTILPTLVS